MLLQMLDADYRKSREAAILAAPKRTWTDVSEQVWRELEEVAGSQPS
jgi:hypothetical protein